MLRLVLAVAAAVLIAAPAAAAAALTSPDAGLLREMNAARAAHGLAPLHVDARLEQAARFHSREMLAQQVFAHGAFADRMARFHVTGSFAGENLAWGSGSRGTARGVVAAWLRSPEHRANLLRPSFRRVGIGTLTGTFEGHAGVRVITADFAG